MFEGDTARNTDQLRSTTVGQGKDVRDEPALGRILMPKIPGTSPNNNFKLHFLLCREIKITN